jgi:hypothetical protein
MMKFTFDYRAKVRFSHDLSGNGEKLDKKFDEMLDFNADKVVANGTGNLDINVMDFVRSLYGVQYSQYVNNGIEVNYQFEYGTVHFWGTAWYDIMDEIVDEDDFDNSAVTDEFGEYVTEKLCGMDDLNLDLEILYKKLSYDGRVYVELLEDSTRCEAMIEKD